MELGERRANFFSLTEMERSGKKNTKLKGWKIISLEPIFAIFNKKHVIKCDVTKLECLFTAQTSP